MSTPEEANAVPMENIERVENTERVDTDRDTNSKVSSDAPIEEGEVIIDTPGSQAAGSSVLTGNPRSMPHKVFILLLPHSLCISLVFIDFILFFQSFYCIFKSYIFYFSYSHITYFFITLV